MMVKETLLFLCMGQKSFLENSFVGPGPWTSLSRSHWSRVLSRLARRRSGAPLRRYIVTIVRTRPLMHGDTRPAGQARGRRAREGSVLVAGCSWDRMGQRGPAVSGMPESTSRVDGHLVIKARRIVVITLAKAPSSVPSLIRRRCCRGSTGRRLTFGEFQIAWIWLEARCDGRSTSLTWRPSR